MWNRVKRCLSFTALLHVVLALVSAPAGAASFRGLGEASGAMLDTLVLGGMNAHGDQLVGSAQVVGPGTPTWFIYDEATLQIGDGGPQLPPGYTGAARGQQTESTKAGNFRRTVGSASGPAFRVFVRTQGGGSDTTVLLPAYPTSSSRMAAYGIGRNGNVIGLYSTGLITRDFFYEAATGSYTSASLHEYNAIAADGDRYVGMIRSSPTDQAHLWDGPAGAQALGFLPGGSASEAFGVSASGRLVVGSSESSATGPGVQEAFRWHPDLGMHPLEPIQGGALRESVALASSDANVVVGSYRSAKGDRAFIWTPAIGREDLAGYLISQYGLFPELFGWTLEAATQISADGKIIAGVGTNPMGVSDSWVVDLDGPAVTELRMRPIEPDGNPSVWEFYLVCGDRPVSQLNFGIIEPTTIPALDLFDFGGCGDFQNGQLLCTGAGEIGPTVDESSFVTLPTGEDNRAIRGDTIYVTLFGSGGNGGRICSPGDDEVFLANFRIEEPTPELMLSALAGRVGLTDGQTEIPLDAIRLIREREDPATEITLRPSLDDTDGTRLMLSFDSDLPLASFSFGLIIPPNASEVTFGGCSIGLGGFQQRGCANGDDLGANINFDKVRTIGPDPELESVGARGDTLYVYVEGQLGGVELLPGLNVPGQRARVGLFEFGTSNPGDFGWVPTVTYQAVDELDAFWNDFQDWTDRDGMDQSGSVTYASYTYGGGDDPDSDGDMIEDADDLCPYLDSTNADQGTLEQPGLLAATVPDGIGDECQCGDLIGPPHWVVPPDLDLLRAALNDPSVAGAIAAAELAKCNSIGPILGTPNSTTQLPVDCNANDIFALLRGRIGQTPLVPSPGAFPSCPDVMNP